MRFFKCLFCLFLTLLVLQVQSEETITLQGRISADGNPPDEVWIGIFSTPVRPRAEALSWNSVDFPEFELAVPDLDEVQLVVLTRDFMPMVQTIHPESSIKQIGLELKKGVTLEGTVLSTDKIPIPDAVLTLERRDLPNVRIPDQLNFSWNSDANGKFTVGGLAHSNRYLVEVGVPNSNISSESFSIEISHSEAQRRDLLLSDAFFVLGRVVDVDQVTVQGAIVSFAYTEDSWGAISLNPTTTSNVDGEFKLGPFERNKEMWVWATHENWGSSPRTPATSGLHDTELVLASLVHVFGTVIDKSSGRPIDEFKLVAIAPDISRDYPHSGTNGKISGLVDRQVTNLILDSALHSPHFKLNVNLESVDEHDMGVIALERGRPLAGRVFDESSGQPISGATVYLQESIYDKRGPGNRGWGIKRLYLNVSVQSTTDEKGMYELVSVPAHSSLIGVYADEYLGKELQVDAVATRLDIPLSKNSAEESANRRISGRVITSTGEPVGGMVHFLKSEGGRASTSTQDDGTFDYWTNAKSGEVYAITDRGRSNKVRVDLADIEGREITLVVDSTGRLRGIIDGLSLDETVSLTIVDESEGFTPTRLRGLGSDDVSGFGLRHVRGLGNGDFVVEGIGIGIFDVTAKTSRNRSQTKSFELSAEKDEASVELNFTGQSRLFGTVNFQNGSIPSGEVKAVSSDSGSTSGWGKISDDGTIEIHGLEDGEYRVLVYETRQATMMTPDGESSATFSKRLVEELDVVIRGDTQLNIQLVSPNSLE